jgi:hypothetical protein
VRGAPPRPVNPAAGALFHARDARPAQPPEAGIEPARTPVPVVRRLIADGEITHAASLVCLLTCLSRGGQTR